MSRLTPETEQTIRDRLAGGYGFLDAYNRSVVDALLSEIDELRERASHAAGWWEENWLALEAQLKRGRHITFPAWTAKEGFVCEVGPRCIGLSYGFFSACGAFVSAAAKANQKEQEP